MRELTTSQLAEWGAYNRLEPIGENRADYRISYLSSLLTNLVIKALGKQGAKLTSVKDFLFKWDVEGEVKPQQSVEAMKSVFLSLASASKDGKKHGSSRPPANPVRRSKRKLKK